MFPTGYWWVLPRSQCRWFRLLMFSFMLVEANLWLLFPMMVSSKKSRVSGPVANRCKGSFLQVNRSSILWMLCTLILSHHSPWFTEHFSLSTRWAPNQLVDLLISWGDSYRLQTQGMIGRMPMPKSSWECRADGFPKRKAIDWRPCWRWVRLQNVQWPKSSWARGDSGWWSFIILVRMMVPGWYESVWNITILGTGNSWWVISSGFT